MAEMNPNMDYVQHDKTYKGFLKMVKWCIISSAILVVLLYIWINP